MATATKAKIKIPGGVAPTDALMNPTASATPKVTTATAKAAPKTGLAAMLALAKAGGAKETTKTSKKGTPELDVPDEIIESIRQFIAADASMKTAEGTKKAERAPIEPALKKAFLEKVRSEGNYFKTVSIGSDLCKGGLMSFSFGRLTIEKPSEARPLEVIEEDLKSLFAIKNAAGEEVGNDYEKYIRPVMALSIKEDALDGHSKTMQTLAYLQDALGAKPIVMKQEALDDANGTELILRAKLGDELYEQMFEAKPDAKDSFGELFDFQASLDLHEKEIGSGTTVEYLTEDYVKSAEIERKLAPAIKSGLLAHQFVTFKSSTSAIAAAGEDQAKDTELLIQAKANAAVSAAMMTASAAMAAK